MDETNTSTETLPPPPGIIGSLRKGFDTVAAHITAILLPLALDLLLWLGPHLSMDQLVQPILKDFGSMASNSGLATGDVNSAINIYQQFFQQFNLLVILRTFPIGVFSLMSGKMPTQSPLGLVPTWQIDSPALLLGLMFLLTIFGWVLGALYFNWIAALITPIPTAVIVRAVFQTLLYSLLWSILSWVVGLPLALIIYIFYLINPLIAEGAILILGFLSMWLIVPIFFSPHGIFVRKQNAFISILSSFQISRFTLPTSSLFVLTILLIGIGLNFLWAIPSDDSWLTLVGILGHAFITTALLASSFVYYRDMGAWLQSVLRRFQSGASTQQTKSG